MDNVKQNYRLSDLARLRSRVASVLGDVIADKWIADRYKRSVNYGMPQITGSDGKKYYTPYGVLTNMDAYPERYVKDIPVTLVSDDEWNGPHSGEFSWLGGIRMPNSQVSPAFPQEQVVTHEQQHYVDAVHAPRNNKNVYPYDTRGLGEVGRLKNMIDSPANTGRSSIGEVMPEILDYESRLPAGKPLTATDFWKGLNSEQRAMIIRKLQPMPEGVDAMTGVVR